MAHTRHPAQRRIRRSSSRLIRFTKRSLSLVLASAAGAFAATPEIVSVERIWDQAPHNAFTDLARFQDRWFCVFREADNHAGGQDGKIRVITSTDGQAWASSALLAEPGVDLRDPKLSITPDGRLMLTAGGSVYDGKRYLTRRPRIAFSADGRTWSDLHRVLAEDHWLWRVTWFKGRAYSVSKLGEGRRPRRIYLYSSRDGLDWEWITELDVPGGANETTVRFRPDGRMIALVRRESGNTFGWIGTSLPPYRKWTWHETKWRLGGPNFIALPDGSLWAGSRRYPGGAKTALARMSLIDYEPVLVLPSGGDTSYPGMVWHADRLWMSYYSSHEGRTGIYLATIRFVP